MNAIFEQESAVDEKWLEGVEDTKYLLVISDYPNIGFQVRGEDAVEQIGVFTSMGGRELLDKYLEELVRVVEKEVRRQVGGKK